MGYDIRPIEEIETFDKTLCYGYPNVDLYARISNNGLFFVVGGGTINNYTESEILVELDKPNWTETIE